MLLQNINQRIGIHTWNDAVNAEITGIKKNLIVITNCCEEQSGKIWLKYFRMLLHKDVPHPDGKESKYIVILTMAQAVKLLYNKNKMGEKNVN